jgi:hypothetical protein
MERDVLTEEYNLASAIVVGSLCGWVDASIPDVEKSDKFLWSKLAGRNGKSFSTSSTKWRFRSIDLSQIV